jgi:hypothetical protein
MQKAREDEKNRRTIYKRNWYKRNRDNPYLGIKIRLMRKVASNKIYQKDNNHTIGLRLRNSLRGTLKRYTIKGKTEKSSIYGINYSEIIEHLKPFPENIRKYHIDHIKPLCSFNLEDKDEIKKAFHPSNLRWLLKKDNLNKIKEDMKMSLHLVSRKGR